MIPDLIEFLLVPEQTLPLYVQNVRDIYERRNILKQLLLSEYALNHLLDIVIDAIQNKERFRTLDCMKVIKAILKNNPFDLELSNKTVKKLFYLFQIFIFHKNEQLNACVNLFIKSQNLDDESIT